MPVHSYSFRNKAAKAERQLGKLCNNSKHSAGYGRERSALLSKGLPCLLGCRLADITSFFSGVISVFVLQLTHQPSQGIHSSVITAVGLLVNQVLAAAFWALHECSVSRVMLLLLLLIF